MPRLPYCPSLLHANTTVSVHDPTRLRVAVDLGSSTGSIVLVDLHYLLYSGSVAAVEEGFLKTITTCTYWFTRSVVSAHRRLLWVAGAKVMMEEGSSLDSGKEEEGNEEEQRNEVVSRGNPYRWDINPKQASSRSTKASLEVGRLRCKAAVRRQSKVFGLYLYDYLGKVGGGGQANCCATTLSLLSSHGTPPSAVD